MGVGKEELGSGGCEPRIEGIVQFRKKKGGGVNQDLMVLYNLEKKSGGGGVPGDMSTNNPLRL